MTKGDQRLTTPSQKPKRKLLTRILGWGAALIAMLLLGVFGLMERIAHRPSPVRMTVTPAEIHAEDVHLRQLGLILRDGSFLKEHPFEPPWTSHSLLIPESWPEPGIRSLLGSRHVRADLLLADLDVFEPVMERAYGGWDSAAARGWNCDQWFAGWRETLRNFRLMRRLRQWTPCSRFNGTTIRKSRSTVELAMAPKQPSSPVRQPLTVKRFVRAVDHSLLPPMMLASMCARRSYGRVAQRASRTCTTSQCRVRTELPRRCAAARTGSHCNPSGTDWET